MDENKTTELQETTPKKKLELPEGVNMDNIQKYVLGTKKNGTPRAVYDIVKDFLPEKKKKHKKKKKDKKDAGDNTYEVYLKKRGKKKKKSKHWHI